MISNGQNECWTDADKQFALTKMQEGKNAKDSLRAYKIFLRDRDSIIAGLQKEIVRKEGVIVRTIDQRNDCFNMRDNLKQQKQLLEETTAIQAATIQKLNKPPRRLGFGITAGYGIVSTNGLLHVGPAVNAGLYFRIL